MKWLMPRICPRRRARPAARTGDIVRMIRSAGPHPGIARGARGWRRRSGSRTRACSVQSSHQTTGTAANGEEHPEVDGFGAEDRSAARRCRGRRCGAKEKPGAGSGPRIRKPMTAAAMELSMIVVTTSCAPVHAFRAPGMKPQTAPASMPGQERRGMAIERRRGRQGRAPTPAAPRRAEQELALGADVEEAGLEADADGQAAEDERRRPGRCVLRMRRRTSRTRPGRGLRRRTKGRVQIESTRS